MQSECAGPDSAESEREVDMDDNDGVASVMSGSVLHGPRSVDSSNSLGKRKSRSGIVFRAWCFQMRFQADFPPASSTAEEKTKILQEHLRLRTGHDRPNCVTFRHSGEMSWLRISDAWAGRLKSHAC